MKKSIDYYVIFQADPRMSLEEKVAQGAAMFKKRFGEVPTTCYLLAGGKIPKKVGPVELRTRHNALQSHFWFSVEERKLATRAND